jgi:phosphoribosylamine--glycine ligase
VNNEPYVIEYNVRLGDPETQAILPRLRSDLLDLFEGIATNTLSERHVDVDDRTAVSIVLASEGYPGKVKDGRAIAGIELVRDAYVFQAGTTGATPDKLRTKGGRVLAVTAFGKDLESAINNAYRNAALIDFEGRVMRSDLGQDLVRTSSKSNSRTVSTTI